MNNQPPELPKRCSKGTLQVHSIWHTIQGEGPFAGCPAVFVRLAGCNLKCPLCDTEYTSRRETMSPIELMDAVEDADLSESKLVVITGGEPFRQRLQPTIRALVEKGFRIQIETNGTYYDPEVFDDMTRNALTVVCSPKVPQVPVELIPYIDYWKYVVEGINHPIDGLPTTTLGMQRPPARPPKGFPKDQILIQPCDFDFDDLNQQSLELSRQIVLKHGYRLCLPS